MGVLACDRGGCENIMCNRIGNLRIGDVYICESCFDELVRIGPATNVEAFMEGELRAPHSLEASRAYFDTLFPRVR